jgi:hypothetical protein
MTIVKYLGIAVVALTMTACATKTSVQTLPAVSVPVIQPYPAVVIPARPTLPIAKVTASTPNGTVALDYQASIVMLWQHITSLENILKGVNSAAAIPTTVSKTQ